LTAPTPDSARSLAPRLADLPGLRSALAGVARETGRDEADVLRAAGRYLRELRSAHSPLVHGLWVRAGRALLGAGYERIDYDAGQLEAVRAVLGSEPAIVLSSHKSYLDGGALTVGFDTYGLPPLTVFGGINMAFWPIGPLWRRANMVFIRRGAEDPVYRCVLRHVLAHLVGARRPLQWFVEGTRSRTGKLGPPRLGLLAYIVDAYREGRIDDLAVLPVAVSYDQLQEVGEYAGEARGAAKTAESLGWLLRFVRAQRGRFGAVYVRFGTPVLLREFLGPPAAAREAPADERRLALHKLAFEVACRINDATPITGASLVALVLLGARDRALTLAQIGIAVQGYLDSAATRGLPRTPTARLDSSAAIGRVLDGLAGQGVVQVHRDGRENIYGVAPGQHLAMAYYRNTVAHFFLPGAIAELALLEAADAPAASRSAAFDAAVLALRDLLEFEFFFRARTAYVAAVHGEIARLAPDWARRLADGPDGVQALLEALPTLSSDMLLRPFLEAYAIVADALVGYGDGAAPPAPQLLAECTGLGEQYLLQKKLGHPESVSRHLFATGLELARRRGLCPGGAGTGARRRQFATEIGGVLRRLARVHAIAVRRVEATLAAQPVPPQR
jgi:glycerol-3-phosphate O-acyltransferase